MFPLYSSIIVMQITVRLMRLAAESIVFYAERQFDCRDGGADLGLSASKGELGPIVCLVVYGLRWGSAYVLASFRVKFT